jgi:hypothetical protein
MNKHPKKNYYSILPSQIRYEKKLNPNAKLLYSEISTLSNKKGYCFATNSYFAQLFKVTNNSISRWISNLESAGYIKSKIIYSEKNKGVIQRQIYLTNLNTGLNSLDFDENKGINSETPINNSDDTPINNSDDTPINNSDDTPINNSDDTPINKIVNNNITGVNNTGVINTSNNNSSDVKSNYFIQFWDIYDKNIGLDKCEKLWADISDADIEKIFQTVELYVQSTPVLEYRKNPETYLRNKCWNDQIIFRNQNNGVQNGKSIQTTNGTAKSNFDNLSPYNKKSALTVGMVREDFELLRREGY